MKLTICKFHVKSYSSRYRRPKSRVISKPLSIAVFHYGNAITYPFYRSRIFFFILRNPIRSGRNLRGDGHLRLITIAPTAACFYRDGFVRSLARTRINKLQRGSVMCPAFSTRPGLIPNNVPRTARRAIENKTPLTPGALFLRTGWIFLWGVYPIL